MAKLLAPSEITIVVDGTVATLRPTLRAAMRLDRAYGFHALATGIADGDIGTMASVIEQGAGHANALVDLLRDIAVNGNVRLDVLREPLLDYLGQLIGETVDEVEEVVEPTDPNAKSVDPGKTAEMVWRFTKAGTFEFACLIPGHREAGMHGVVNVK